MQTNPDIDAIKREVVAIKQILAEQQGIEMSESGGFRNIWCGYISVKLTEVDYHLRRLERQHISRDPGLHAEQSTVVG